MFRGTITYGKDQDKLTEKKFQRQVVENAIQIFGWKRKYHNLYAPGSDAGYPDLTLIHYDHGALWLEIKGQHGLPSPVQVDWIQDMRMAGLHAYIVYPKDIHLVDGLLQGWYPVPVKGGVVPELEPLLINELKTKASNR